MLDYQLEKDSSCLWAMRTHVSCVNRSTCLSVERLCVSIHMLNFPNGISVLELSQRDSVGAQKYCLASQDFS